MSAKECIHVRLTSDQRNALEHTAAHSNKSISEVVRDLLTGLTIHEDIKRAQADEARATRITLEVQIENMRRDVAQALLDLRTDLRDDLKRSAVATIEAITGKTVVINRGEHK